MLLQQLEWLQKMAFLKYDNFVNCDRQPSWIFGKFEILTAGTVRRANMRDHAKFCADWSNRCGECGDMFLRFLRWRPSAILYLLHAGLDHLRSIVGGFYRSEKFGWNRHCSFENIRFLMLCEFG